MYEYISGKIIQTTPAYVVIENVGIGYFINISLNTFEALKEKKEATLYIYEHIREDTHSLYGFSELRERECFQLLLSVSGIGANTARMILSSLPPDDLQQAISSENVSQIKNIKGIGQKTAQRVIIDLKDKIVKTSGSSEKLPDAGDNTKGDEALSALVMLGFSKGPSQKVIDKILRENPGSRVEDIIKLALKML
ncbi:MAG: Holliday junction branch migration protein RuvA [Marinilabiliaceae bacterium]